MPRSSSGWLRSRASCSVHPAPAWSPRGLRLRGCLDVVWLLVGWVAVRLWAFFLLGFHLAACFPYGWLVWQLGGLPPIFSLTFSFGVVVAPWFLVGILQRFSPPGGFLLQFFLRLSCLRFGGGGFGWLSLAGPYVLRDVFPGACLLLSSSPLALHGVVSTSPVFLSRAPAFRQVRVAMLAEGSVESPSVLVLAFHSSLFLVEGSSDGSAPGDRFSPLDGCVSSLRFSLRSVASALSLLGSWAFLPPLSVSLLSGVVAPFLEETGRSSRRFSVFQSSTWWSSV